MTTLPLARDAERFQKSSAYRYGDPTSFSVRLHSQVTLPGKCDPAGYLDDIGLSAVPERVLVVCPGNGGLVAECFRRGAKFVTLLEPRDRYHQPLRRVLSLLAQGWRLEDRKGLNHRLVESWPLSEAEQQSLGKHDLVLWSEGMEDITEPKVIFSALSELLSESGKLYVEVTHGRHALVESINAWKPTPLAFKELAVAVFSQEPAEDYDGRRVRRKIYALKKPADKKPTKKASSTSKKKPKTDSVAPPEPPKMPEPPKVETVTPEPPTVVLGDVAESSSEPEPEPEKPAETPNKEESDELDISAALDEAVAEKPKKKSKRKKTKKKRKKTS